jgi:hypothetical protein
MIYHDLPCLASLLSFLVVIDQDQAAAARKQGCPCGGHLHSANYLRKPRGTPAQLPAPQCVTLCGATRPMPAGPPTPCLRDHPPHAACRATHPKRGEVSRVARRGQGQRCGEKRGKR